MSEVKLLEPVILIVRKYIKPLLSIDVSFN